MIRRRYYRDGRVWTVSGVAPAHVHRGCGPQFKATCIYLMRSGDLVRFATLAGLCGSSSWVAA